MKHRLLLRQLKRCFGISSDPVKSVQTMVSGLLEHQGLSEEQRDFIQALPQFFDKVDNSYQQADRDLKLRSESLRLSSEELNELNERLRVEAEQQALLVTSIRESVNGLLRGFGEEELSAKEDNIGRLAELMNELLEQKEEAQLELERQKQALDHHAIVSVSDLEGNILYANDRFCEISGYSRSELIGQNHRLVRSDEHPKEYYADLWRVISSGEVWSGEMKNATKDGGYYWVSATIVPILDQQAKPIQYISIRTDITLRKRMEEELERERSFLRSISDAMGEGVYAVDEHGFCTFLNREAEGLLGWTQDQMIGTPLHDLIHYQDKDGRLVSSHQCPVMQANHNGEVYRSENEIFTRKNKLIFPVSLVSVPLMQRGQLKGAVAVFQDITKRKNTEKALSDAKTYAEEANRYKSEFLANMSHEIRTPMNAVIGLCHLALNAEMNPKQRNYLNKIQSSARGLLGIINDILDFSKIEAGRMSVEQTSFNIDDVLEQVSIVVSVKAEEKQIELYISRDPEVSPTLIGDPLRLTQILTNLANNAIKFTKQGRVVISVEKLETIHEDEQLLQFVVEDSGIGMSDDQLGKIFKPFSQADTSTTRNFGGTGLGLAICRRLAQLMRGTIKAESTLGVGSIFRVTLPMKKDLETLNRPPNQNTALAGLNALIITPEVDQGLVRSLEMFGLSVSSCTQSEYFRGECDALSIYQSPDLLLLRLDYDDQDPMDLVQKAVEISPNSFVLVVSSLFNVGTMNQLLADKPIHLLAPPLNPSRLLDAIVDLMGSGQVVSHLHRVTHPSGSVDSVLGADVLLVEDNQINTEVATHMLENLGINVRTAEDGGEALEKLASHTFDLVLMDVQMPIMDGYEATRRIRSMDRYAELPIIALTAHAMSGDKEKSLQAGMNDHLTKPIDPDELFEMLLRWLGNRKPRFTESVLQQKRSNTEQKLSSTVLLETIPELDVRIGLKRLGGNRGLYIDLLKRFFLQYQDVDTQIKDLLERQQLQQAKELVHRLKGVVGTLAADEVYRLACSIEGSLKKGQFVDEEQVEQLSIAMSSLLQSLKLAGIDDGKASDQSVVAVKVDKEVFGSLYERTRTLLLEGDVSVLETLTEWQKLLEGSASHAELSVLLEQIGNFDFELALDTLSKLAASTKCGVGTNNE